MEPVVSVPGAGERPLVACAFERLTSGKLVMYIEERVALYLGQKSTETSAFDMVRSWVMEFWVGYPLGRVP